MIPQALVRRTSIRHKSLGEPIEAMENLPGGLLATPRLGRDARSPGLSDSCGL
jgi:hypothetical protein